METNNKFVSTERYFEAMITEISDGGVTIELRGRLGTFKLPKRMIVCKDELKIGQTVGFMMTYPEVIDDK